MKILKCKRQNKNSTKLQRPKIYFNQIYMKDFLVNMQEKRGFLVNQIYIVAPVSIIALKGITMPLKCMD